MVKLKVTPTRERPRRGRRRCASPGPTWSWPSTSTAPPTREAVEELARHGLVYIEQPAPAEALRGVGPPGHARRVPDRPRRVRHLARRPRRRGRPCQAGSIVNVKPARCGGPHAAATDGRPRPQRRARRVRRRDARDRRGPGRGPGGGRPARLPCCPPTSARRTPTSTRTSPSRSSPTAPAASRSPMEPGIGRAPLAGHLDEVVVDHLTLTR